MNRRKFIIISTTGIAALSVPLFHHFLDKKVNSNPLIYPQILSQLWHEDTIKFIGSSYLSQVPKENDRRIVGRDRRKREQACQSGKPEGVRRLFHPGEKEKRQKSD